MISLPLSVRRLRKNRPTSEARRIVQHAAMWSVEVATCPLVRAMRARRPPLAPWPCITSIRRLRPILRRACGVVKSPQPSVRGIGRLVNAEARKRLERAEAVFGQGIRCQAVGHHSGADDRGARAPRSNAHMTEQARLPAREGFGRGMRSGSPATASREPALGDDDRVAGKDGGSPGRRRSCASARRLCGR